jgi:AbrB family looped-hinge helix DNA binding protein
MYFRYTISSRLIKMEISLTKLSPNGQVVIPSEIRKEAGLKPSTKFIVFNEGGNILLKQIRTETLRKDVELLERIQMTEEQIATGKIVKANTSMSDEEIDDLLMH